MKAHHIHLPIIVNVNLELRVKNNNWQKAKAQIAAKVSITVITAKMIAHTSGELCSKP